MDHKEELENLHKQSKARLDEFISGKSPKPGDEEAIRKLKDEWELSWNKLMETLLVLERLEI